MQSPSLTFGTLAGAVLLGLSSVAVAHGHDEDMSIDVSSTRPTITTTTATPLPAPDTYWSTGGSLLTAHIALMTIAWIFILPISVMISIARSRYTLPVQFLFLITNGIGVFLITIYNASTPDLYPNNAHHKLGWILTWIISAQVVLGIISAYTNRNDDHGFMPISTEAMAEHQRRHDLRRAETYRFSNDSGQGTEPNTESLRSQSISSTHSDLPDTHKHEDEEEEEEKGLMHGSKVDKFLKSRIPGLLSSRVLKAFRFAYNAVDRLILILGFVGFTTGIISYGGFFMGPKVFSGLAHWIKGGIFFWYGILTLGRWAGCFADIGWAWNIKPLKSRAVSAEFVESFLIFFYGSTNVFLEHLTAWGKEWSAQDLEHISITVMFFGGGLCGMLIESHRIRNLLNVVRQSDISYDPETTEEPKSYRTPMNPLPALVVLLLGLMMSSHHQESMVSTMIHTQWGTLLAGAAFARAATYIIFYLSPPSSIFPGRPPAELITAFCLMAGGMIFMSSARDTVEAMEAHNLDAMFMFTISMGVITFLMAWIIAVIAIKGVAVRRENRSAIFRGVA
ncbi:related to YTP1 [Phialocephala subalpina]|uniref:Related to YTP1 n=1 Tax=Phialocephala subalpina TaxID=576137 RepID=A0A1L7WXN1_9HELO|nr:related to YTP1 [Phialocephala subalpina]